MVRARSSTRHPNQGERPGQGPSKVLPVGVVSSALAPVLLIGGWTLAAALQPTAFDSVRDTISQLAAVGMPHRWVMTVGLAGLGLCHLVTASALRPATFAGRGLLALGGVGTLLVAANPLPSGGGGSRAHTLVAGVAFVALSLWPLLAARRTGSGRLPAGAAASPVLDWWLRLTASAVLTALLVWFFWALQSAGPVVGLTERAVAGAQSLWPLVVVLGLRLETARTRAG